MSNFLQVTKAIFINFDLIVTIYIPTVVQGQIVTDKGLFKSWNGYVVRGNSNVILFSSFSQNDSILFQGEDAELILAYMDQWRSL